MTPGPNTSLLLGANVRRLRRAQGLSQEDLADRSGISNRYLGRIERGEANPSLDILERLSTSFGVDLVDLLSPLDAYRNARGRRSKTPDASRIDTLRLSEKVAVYLTRLDDKARKRALRIIKALGDPD
ncbi:MAG: helix-turn-helix transcriptional regulator [Deltaproteobacteria bacterium]|nr:helix-turn-helix transcriptional regulator [Deltaproteobacteria bacterium]